MGLAKTPYELEASKWHLAKVHCKNLITPLAADSQKAEEMRQSPLWAVKPIVDIHHPTL